MENEWYETRTRTASGGVIMVNRRTGERRSATREEIFARLQKDNIIEVREQKTHTAAKPAPPVQRELSDGELFAQLEKHGLRRY
jgi:hypothetical protein